MPAFDRKRMGLAIAFVVLMIFFLVVAFIGAQQQKVYRSKAHGEPPDKCNLSCNPPCGGGYFCDKCSGRCEKESPPPPVTRPPPPPPITLTPTPVIPCPRKPQGDANCDGKIDGIDYSIWLNSQCQPGANQSCADLRADFNGDHKVNDDDYQIWFKNRGT